MPSPVIDQLAQRHYRSQRTAPNKQSKLLVIQQKGQGHRAYVQVLVQQCPPNNTLSNSGKMGGVYFYCLGCEEAIHACDSSKHRRLSRMWTETNHFSSTGNDCLRRHSEIEIVKTL